MTRAVLIQRSPSERQPGPRKPPSPAQKRATQKWIRNCPGQFEQWRKGLTPLPRGWSAKGGVLRAEPHLWDGDGRLRQPRSGPCGFCGPYLFDVLQRAPLSHKDMNKLKDYSRVELKGRSWEHGRLDDDHPEWLAIRAWIDHFPNMRRANGRPSFFRLIKSRTGLAIWFTDANVAMRFFEAFALPA